MNTNETTNAACLLGALGGKARAARLTPAERTEAARRAGKARQQKAREARLTLVHDRFQVCCTLCGFVSGHTTKADAISAAERHGCKTVEVWDAMAHNKERDIVWKQQGNMKPYRKLFVQTYGNECVVEDESNNQLRSGTLDQHAELVRWAHEQAESVEYDT